METALKRILTDSDTAAIIRAYEIIRILETGFFNHLLLILKTEMEVISSVRL